MAIAKVLDYEWTNSGSSLLCKGRSRRGTLKCVKIRGGAFTGWAS